LISAPLQNYFQRDRSTSVDVIRLTDGLRLTIFRRSHHHHLVKVKFVLRQRANAEIVVVIARHRFQLEVRVREMRDHRHAKVILVTPAPLGFPELAREKKKGAAVSHASSLNSIFAWVSQV
jgi:hypothetical protein